MTDSYNVAVVGATGVVGEALLECLADAQFPVGTCYLLAGEHSEGEVRFYNKKPLLVERLNNFDFSKVQLAFFSAGSDVSADYVPKATAAGCIVIDNTSKFRYDDDVPLVVPEVNPEAIAGYKARNLIANPNCSTIQMVVALKPIYDAVGIERINVATYQAVSGSGRKAISELVQQTSTLLNGIPIEHPEIYPQAIAFNVIPFIESFEENGYSREEMKMIWETKKIFGDDTIQVNPTAARVPVFFGHSEAIHIETKRKITVAQARACLMEAPGVELIDEPEQLGFPTAARDAVGSDAVYIGRLREDISHPSGLNMWVVADNVRKGAAKNSVQIAQLLIKSYL